MNRWAAEDWEFTVTVVEGEARSCRLGIEKGDTFVFQYGCPDSFCPRVMLELFAWCEIIRCGGNFLARGSTEQYAMEFPCPCRSETFRLTAAPINRDENGVYRGESKKPPKKSIV